MENFVYRKSIKEDIPLINDLFIEMIKTVNKRMELKGFDPYKDLENGYEEGYLDNFYDNDDKIIFVAEDNNIVIGFISVVLFKEEGYIYLDDYSVKEKYRGQGIGSELMNMAFEYAKEKGIKTIITHVESANSESINFYKNKGFKLVEEQGHRLLIKKEYS